MSLQCLLPLASEAFHLLPPDPLKHRHFDSKVEVVSRVPCVMLCPFLQVEDRHAPSITCPADIQVHTEPGTCQAIVQYAAVAFDDNCAVTVSTVVGPASGQAFSLGTTTVTLRATDDSSNTEECSFTVTVSDNQNPEIACPANINVATSDGACAAAVSYTPPTGTDNCPSASTSQIAGLASGSTFLSYIDRRSITNSFRVTDSSGRTATCTFTVRVYDDQSPIPACPASIT